MRLNGRSIGWIIKQLNLPAKGIGVAVRHENVASFLSLCAAQSVSSIGSSWCLFAFFFFFSCRGFALLLYREIWIVSSRWLLINSWVAVGRNAAADGWRNQSILAELIHRLRKLQFNIIFGEYLNVYLSWGDPEYEVLIFYVIQYASFISYSFSFSCWNIFNNSNLVKHSTGIRQ